MSVVAEGKRDNHLVLEIFPMPDSAVLDNRSVINATWSI